MLTNKQAEVESRVVEILRLGEGLIASKEDSEPPRAGWACIDELAD